MATVAAIGVAAAGVGMSAYKASQGSGSSSKSSSTATVQLPAWAKMFNRGTSDILDEQRQMLENAAAENNAINPSLWAALGFTPVYDPKQDADVSALGAQRDAANKAYEDARSSAPALRQQAVELQRSLKSAPDKATRRGIKAQIRDLHKQAHQAMADLPRLQHSLSAAAAALGDAQTAPRRILSLQPRDTSKVDPNATPDQQALDLEHETLLRALNGDEPVNSTLSAQMDIQEQQLRENLRRQLGPDYAASSSGQAALANFSRQKSQAFDDWNQNVIRSYQALAIQQQANILGGETGVANNDMNNALAFGSAAGMRNQTTQVTGGVSPHTDAGTQQVNSGGGTAALLGSLGQGLQGASGAIGGLGGGATASAYNASATAVTPGPEVGGAGGYTSQSGAAVYNPYMTPANPDNSYL